MQARKLSKADEERVERAQGEMIELIRALCAIPAPSGREERRAEFIRDWFAQRGMRAEIDAAKNALYPVALDRFEDVVVIAAHTDTVFPDLEPMPFAQGNGRLCCPGVGDDTANVAALMLLAEMLKGRSPRCGVLFAFDAGEEGLGNLRGAREIMRAYGPRVRAFIALDGQTDAVCARAVGSTRYRIAAQTRGGHSYSNFGERNAIAVLSELVCALYAQPLPKAQGATTTYNVGRIEGGTSVNAIAQRAQMLYEFRSDDEGCLAAMRAQLEALLRAHAKSDARLTCEAIGERPCGRREIAQAQRRLEAACVDALRRYAGASPEIGAGSTDCNIPLSMGVPAACFGVYRGEGAHTREEWIDTASLCGGMKAALSVLLGFYA